MRKIFVSVITRSTQRGIEWVSDTEAKVWVHAAPEKGKANKEGCEVIAEELSLRPYQVRISAGEMSSKKIIEIIK